MADIRAIRGAFLWTDDEVELLLRVTLEYKTTKVQENVDWESCKCKYSDISRAFHAQYPRTLADKDFPHDANAITKVQLTAKLKQIRNKYRQLVNTGSRSHQGRVMLLFFELCEEVWGGSPFNRTISSPATSTSSPATRTISSPATRTISSPATRTISSPATRTIGSLSSGIETGDLEESYSGQSASPSLERSKDLPQPQSSQSTEGLPAAVVKQRRDLLQPKLNSHRIDRLKRTLPADNAVQEDIQIKRRMLGTMEQTSSRNADNMLQINANFASISSTIQESFSLMRDLMRAPPHSSGGGYGQSQEHSPPVMQSLLNNKTKMVPQEVEHVNRSSSRIRNQKRLKCIDDGDKNTNEEEEEDQEDDEQPNTSEHTKRTQPRLVTVTCGNKTGILYVEKLERGEECIKSEGRWFDPKGYEIFGGKPLQFWIDKCKIPPPDLTSESMSNVLAMKTEEEERVAPDVADNNSKDGWCTPLQEDAQNEENGAHRVSPIDDPIDISTTVQPSEEQLRERFTQSNEIKEGGQRELQTETSLLAPATSTPTIKPELLEKTEDTETASVQTAIFSGSPPLLVTHITGNTRDASSNTAYIHEGPQRKLDDGCHDETEVTTSGHDAAQLQVMETETRVPQASKSTPVSTSCNLDTMDLEQLKREKIKMKLKIMKLQEEYYTLKIREIKK
ncbi:mucin-5AC-like [Trematomus bernacchii]|uniref:mucin-5AC-like n=1 Tax=Trematomus bernacchii TaxID=40690 RepID=UPI00146F7642|nr:mucin-5AC-like [Trematomus bernacchii]